MAENHTSESAAEEEERLQPEETAEFETLLDKLGNFGRYQRVIFVILKLCTVMHNAVLLFVVFATFTPKWHCSGFALGVITYIGSNQTEGGPPYVSMSLSNATFEQACAVNNTKCAKFFFEDSLVTIVSEWDLVCDNGHIPQLVTSVFWSGIMVGALVIGQISDWYGRKKVLIASLTLMGIIQVAVGLSVNWQMYAALRFMVGITLGGAYVLTFTFPMEYVGPRWRTFGGGLGLFGVGDCLVTLLAYLVKDWRHLAFITGAIFLPLVVVVAIVVPESVRWLIHRHYYFDATQVMRRWAKYNKRPMPDKMLVKKIALAAGDKIGNVPRYGFLDLFRGRLVAKRTLVIMFSWFCISCTYHTASTDLTRFLGGNVYLSTAITGVPAMIVAWTVIPMANWLGRKRCFAFHTGITAAVRLLVLLVLAATIAAGRIEILVTTLEVVVRVGSFASVTHLGIYSSELYPTLLRNIGVGCGCALAMVGGIAAPYILHMGNAVHWALPHVLNLILALSSLALVLIVLPETKGQPLPEGLHTSPKKGSRTNHNREGQTNVELEMKEQGQTANLI